MADPVTGAEARALIVTGAGGRIGRMLRRIWAQNPPAGLHPLWLGRGAGMDITWDIGTGDLPDWPADAVVLHLAGILRAPPAELAGNAGMVAPLLAACRKNRAKALLVASTAAIYAPSARPAEETDTPAPVNDYGRAKLAMEQALVQAAPDLPITCLRIGNVAGADALLAPRPSDAPLQLDPVEGRAGGPLRSWIGPLSLAEALVGLANMADRLPPRLNLTQDPPLCMGDLLTACGKRWDYGPANPAVVPAAVLSTAALAALLPLPLASPQGIAAEVAAVNCTSPERARI